MRTAPASVSTHAPARGRPPRRESARTCPSFNSRPREGATEERPRRRMDEQEFQLTPPRGGDPRRSRGHGPHRPGFNSRPREGATWSSFARAAQLPPVSTHAPARGRPPPVSGWWSGSAFQLTPPRGGDRKCGAIMAGGVPVSTHAPARGRPSSSRPGPICGGFQLTPPRGGDPHRDAAPKCGVCFNSRPREGATRAGSWTPWRGGSFNSRPREGATRPRTPERSANHVSTHAPARGRQGAAIRAAAAAKGFQLTPPRGGDVLGRLDAGAHRGFNSRPREGATNPLRAHTPAGPCFNSRPREGATTSGRRPPRGASRFQLTPPRGGDPEEEAPTETPVPVSTHAPARGRLPSTCRRSAPTPFQLTPPRGGDRPASSMRITLNCFNSRPREGATFLQSAMVRRHTVSTHAPARGRRCGCIRHTVEAMFQLTPPRGGDIPGPGAVPD